jgi:2-hydroxymuconate-semialdehyde hydrolase
MSATIETRDLVVGDVTFHLSETGPRDAHPIVFLHGSGPGVNALSNWEWMIGELGDAYHCIAPDIVGFGRSTHPDPAPEGMSAFSTVRVDTLLALFDSLGLDKVSLVGNSMGGMLSLGITQQAPDRVAHLILMGAGGAPGLTPLPGLKKIIHFYDDPTEQAMADLLTHFVHDQTVFGDRLHEIAADRLPLATRPEVERSHRATFSSGPGKPPYDAREPALAQMSVPTLVVHGDDDQVVSPASGEHYARHIPNARLEIFANTGHWLQIEQGPQFAALLRSFLTAP